MSWCHLFVAVACLQPVCASYTGRVSVEAVAPQYSHSSFGASGSGFGSGSGSTRVEEDERRDTPKATTVLENTEINTNSKWHNLFPAGVSRDIHKLRTAGPTTNNHSSHSTTSKLSLRFDPHFSDHQKQNPPRKERTGQKSCSLGQSIDVLLQVVVGNWPAISRRCFMSTSCSDFSNKARNKALK